MRPRRPLDGPPHPWQATAQSFLALIGNGALLVLPYATLRRRPRMAARAALVAAVAAALWAALDPWG